MALPRFVQERCVEAEPGMDEIVICGRRDDARRYRIPEELRGSGPIETRNMSHLARMRDQRSAARYGGQTVGPFGHGEAAAQAGCEWRVARQIAQGRQPDCTAKAKKDDPADWRRH